MIDCQQSAFNIGHIANTTWLFERAARIPANLAGTAHLHLMTYLT
jgi:hypothetical protein